MTSRTQCTQSIQPPPQLINAIIPCAYIGSHCGKGASSPLRAGASAICKDDRDQVLRSSPVIRTAGSVHGTRLGKEYEYSVRVSLFAKVKMPLAFTGFALRGGRLGVQHAGLQGGTAC